MITLDSLPWDSENIAIWRQFLLTPTGQRLLPKVAECAEALLRGGETNAILIRSGEVRGVQRAVRTLLTLAQETPKEEKQPDNYPNLLDDTAWDDKQKIEIPNQQ